MLPTNCNRLFKLALRRYSIDSEVLARATLGPGMQELLSQGFLQEEALLLIRAFASRLPNAPRSHQDEIERWVNAIHVEDLEPNLTKPRDWLIQGMKFAEALPNYLPENRDKDVQVLLAITDPEFCPEIHGVRSLPSSSLHLIQRWPEDLYNEALVNEFKHEAVATYTFNIVA